MKIGRNDLCPCGSGEKYKKCCLDKPIPAFDNIVSTSKRQSTPPNKFDSFVEQHNSGDLLNLITSLQLIPKNHGKNIRIEMMAMKVVGSINEGEPVNLEELKDITSSEFSSHYLEDLPENNFTENVIFFGGNYTVIPGIGSNAAEIFRTLAEVIFMLDNDLPSNFKYTAHQAITWNLELTGTIYRKVGLKRYEFESDPEDDILFPNAIIDFSFSESEINNISTEFELSETILGDFIADPNAIDFQNNDTESNPLLKRPLIKLRDRVYFVLPSAQLTSVNEYILKKADGLGCIEGLLAAFNKRLWIRSIQKLEKMGWRPTDIKLPDKNANQLRELVLQIDDDKLAYVVFAPARDMNSKPAERNNPVRNSPDINKRLHEVISFLKARKGLEHHEFLTLFLVANVGQNVMYAFNQPEKGEERIWFSVFDFARLVDHEKWDMLSIWRFAKTYRLTNDVTRIFSTSMLDVYWAYKKNDESFYHSDEGRSSVFHVVPGTGSDITRTAIKNEDLHGAMREIDGQIGHVYVKRAFTPAPVYKRDGMPKHRERLLECYTFPIWISDTHSADKVSCQIFINAIAFWMFKLHAYLPEFGDIDKRPRYIELTLDEEYFGEIPVEKIDLTANVIITYSNKERTIRLKIPYSLSNFLRLQDNSGERLLMAHIAHAIAECAGIKLSDGKIKYAIESAIPKGPAKMILLSDTGANIRIDPRWLISNRYVSDGEIAHVLDGLSSFIPKTLWQNINSRSGKVNVCNAIVTGLIKTLRGILSQYNSVELTKRLMLVHEGYVMEREYQKIHIPAKIACFSNLDQQIREILTTEKKLVNSTLAIRCLLEFIVAEPSLAGKPPNFSDIDKMLAIMHEIVNWGFLSDAIHLGLDDTEIDLLPSGRIGTDKTFYAEKLRPYSSARTRIDLERYIDRFGDHFTERKTAERKPTGFQIEVDEAFLNDWDITLTGILSICECLSIIAERAGNSIIELPRHILIDEIKKITTLGNEQIEVGITKLSLTKRSLFHKPPTGFRQNDIYPWKYNREFSLLRRPLIVIVNNDGIDICYWGMRNSYSAGQQLLQLLYSGRLFSEKCPDIKIVLGKINQSNGKAFRTEVMTWFKNNTGYDTIPHEVSIRPGGHIDADKDYGDVDVFVIDNDSRNIYSIECKDTDQPKNIHEMKGELDKYLGKDSSDGLINKHVERDEYLRNHLSKIIQVANPANYTISSIVVTSEELPLAYLKAKLPVPVISFPKLKREGAVALNL